MAHQRKRVAANDAGEPWIDEAAHPHPSPRAPEPDSDDEEVGDWRLPHVKSAHVYKDVQARENAHLQNGDIHYNAVVHQNHYYGGPQPTSGWSDRKGGNGEKADKSEEEQEWDSLLRTIELLQFDQMHSRYLNIREAGISSCQWLLDDDQYMMWLNSAMLHRHHRFLWIKGKPGAGKSTLIKYALDNTVRATGDIVTSFFFHARGSHLQSSVLGMYRSLLHQLSTGLLRHWTAVPFADKLKKLKRCLNRISREPGQVWPLAALQQDLRATLVECTTQRVFCYIDALDEGSQDDIRDMVAFLEELAEDAITIGRRFYVCFSSRHYPHIGVRKGLEMVLQTRTGHRHDIAQFIRRTLRVKNAELNSQLRRSIEQRAHGVFLWVFLVVRILNKEYDEGNVDSLQQRLDGIPDDLGPLFADILRRALDVPNMKGRLVLTLQWVLYASRPLRPEELYYAILAGVQLSAVTAWDRARITPDDIARFLLNSSQGLVEFAMNTSTAQFIHETVREYFLHGGLVSLDHTLRPNLTGLSHDRLRACCQEYLSVVASNVPCFQETHSHSDYLTLWSAVLRYPFLKYALAFLFRHADNAQEAGVQQSESLRNFVATRWAKPIKMFVIAGEITYPSTWELINGGGHDAASSTTDLLKPQPSQADGNRPQQEARSKQASQPKPVSEVRDQELR